MLPTTIDAIKAILTADPTMNPERRKAVMETIRRNPEEAAAPEDHILRRSEVARRLGVTVKAIDAWRRKGVLQAVTIPGGSRILGFRNSDVAALISGTDSQLLA